MQEYETMMTKHGSTNPMRNIIFLGELPSFSSIVQEKVLQSSPSCPQIPSKGGSYTNKQKQMC